MVAFRLSAVALSALVPTAPRDLVTPSAEQTWANSFDAYWASAAFAGACERASVRRSMSAVGSSANNAAAESWNASMKRETLKGAKAHNTRRRHSRLGQRSPIAYENALFAPSTTLSETA